MSPRHQYNRMMSPYFRHERYQQSWGGKTELKIENFFKKIFKIFKKTKYDYNKYLDEFYQIRNIDCQNFEKFDKENNIDTSNPISFSFEKQMYQSGILDNSKKYENSNGFQNAPLPYIDKINNKLEEIVDKSKYSFIDIGSGKGKIIFYNLLKKELYKEYVGIEIDKDLFDISNDNLQNTNIEIDKKITFLNEDALSVDLPNADCIYFIFRPFKIDLHREFILKNKNKFMSNKTVIVLLCPYAPPEGCPETEIGLSLHSSSDLINIYTSPGTIE